MYVCVYIYIHIYLNAPDVAQEGTFMYMCYVIDKELFVSYLNKVRIGPLLFQCELTFTEIRPVMYLCARTPKFDSTQIHAEICRFVLLVTSATAPA
jgi:hypothetical protein